MMKIKSAILAFIFSVCCLLSFAQGDSSFLTKASQKLQDHFLANPVEKVYLHLAKPGYFIGDTIWFKAYTVIGDHHQLSALSKVLYCELISSQDSVIQRQTLKLTSGIAWSNFALSRSNKPGIYRIRAYTNWMRNQPSAYFFDQTIKIAGPQTGQVAAAVHEKPDVQFFPEGGQLVNGLRSKVAIKCLGADGLGLNVSAKITDNNGDVVATVATQHLGMGVFALTPQSGKVYKAEILLTDSARFTFDLPKASEAGFTLAVNNSDADSIYLSVAANEKIVQAQPGNTLYVIAQAGGKVYYTAKTRLTGKSFASTISKNRFPMGIVQFTLFTQNGEPLNERLIFVQHDDLLHIALSTPAKTYAPATKVRVDITARGDSAKPVSGSFSVSVINESRVLTDENTEITILNNLLLASDLRGYIEQPNYYFTDVNDQKRADLDILMLTQGYRRFDWEKVLQENKQYSPLYKPESGLELSGTLKTPAGKPVANGRLTLAAPHEGFYADTTTDAYGNFRFTDLALSDTSKIILRARKQNNGSNVAIYLKQADFPGLPAINRAEPKRQQTDSILNGAAVKNNIGQQPDSLNQLHHLNEVVIKDKAAPKPDQYNSYGAGYEYDLDMKKLNKDAVDLAEALDYAIPGLSYNGKRFSYDFKPVSVNIDELPRSADDVHYFKPGEIQSIRLIDRTARHPATLMITTKKYAGTDTTAMVKLKEVVIKDKRTPKPDQYNHYGTRQEFVVDVDRLAKEYDADTKNGIQLLVPGLHESNDRWYYGLIDPKHPEKNQIKKIVIDGFDRTIEDLNYYSGKEIESIRVVDGGGLPGDNPVIIVNTKRYAGTDTTATLKLKEVQVKSKVSKKPDLSGSANLHGGGNADQVLMGNDFTACITLEDCLNGKLMGIIFKDGKPYNMRRQNHLTAVAPMAVILDGAPLQDFSVNDINPNDVYSIEVLRSVAASAIYGSSAPNGALIITTRRGSDPKYQTSEVPSGLILYAFRGYHKARMFYTPQYDHQATPDHPFDARTTIYWNPNILTDKDGNASIEFFNADTRGTYRVVIEGIDDEGNIGRTVYRYSVR